MLNGSRCHPSGRSNLSPLNPFAHEGGFFEFGQEPLENPFQIFDHIVVPDADHAIAEGAQPAVTLSVCGAFRVLAAVELDYQAPLAAPPP